MALRRVLLLIAICGMASAAAPKQEPRKKFNCAFANLAGDIGQYPTNWIDVVAQRLKSVKGDNGQTPKLIKKWKEPQYSPPSSCKPEQYRAIADEVAKLVKDGTVAGATILRMAFHTCGTWTQSAQNGGCGGAWHSFPEEMKFATNNGIEPAIDAMPAIRKKYPCITKSDLYTFSGVVAQEAAGGPAVAWHPGRRDALAPGPITVPFSARLPDGNFAAAGVLYNFLNYGLTVRETVALIGGGHSFGGADATTTGWDGVFTVSSDVWHYPKNQYFRDLVSLAWVPEEVKATGRVQFVIAPDESVAKTNTDGQKIIRLPSDMALRESPDFAFWSVSYAASEDLFIRDYVRTLQRTLQFGAGINYELSTAYTWKGFNNDAFDWGVDIQPLLDSDLAGLPKGIKHVNFASLSDSDRSGVVNIAQNKITPNDKPAPKVPIDAHTYHSG